MTEEEAKTKWCCGPKVFADATLAVANAERDRPAPQQQNGLCVASACMAWRRVKSIDLDTGQAIRHPGDGGYCGLAGQP